MVHHTQRSIPWTIVHGPPSRLEPIMFLKLSIMLLSSAKSSLLCSKLCSEIQIMLIGTVKFNTFNLDFIDFC